MGVPAGTKGSLMSMVDDVEKVRLPIAATLDLGEGADAVSAAQGTELAETSPPPALTRSIGAPGAPTVSLAADVVAVPLVLVNTARYRLSLSAVWTTRVKVVDVAPATSLNVAPASVDTCH